MVSWNLTNFVLTDMILLHPTQFFAATVMVAMAASWIYLLLTKYRVWEYLQVHADKWLETLTHRRTECLNEFFSCIFWCGFTVSAILCIVALCLTRDWSYMLIPFCATPIVRKFA